MYVLLPPSETKHAGGRGPSLSLDDLSFPVLRRTRDDLIAAVGRLADDLPSARVALKVSQSLDADILLNREVLRGPTMPALSRYTGILYTALNTPKLTRAEASRAEQRVLIASALFGLVTGADLIPAYRLSANSRLPGMPTIAACWRAVMPLAFATVDGPVLDLRSGAYAAFAPLQGAISVRVVTVTRSGVTKPVSHDNKAIKGVLARLVATTRAAVNDVPGLLKLAYRSGLSVKRTGPSAVDLIAPPVPV